MWQVAFSSKSVSWKTSPVCRIARRAVDERDLAEERRLRVAGELRADHLGAVAVRRDVDDLARPRSAPRARRHERPTPGTSERVGRAHDAVGPAPVRGREDLLGGDVRQVLDPGRRLERRAHPAGRSEQADDEVVPGPRKRIASKPRSLRAAERALSAAACSCHAATGSSASSRIAVATASQRRSRSGSPKIVRAHPSFGAGTITQLVSRSVTSGQVELAGGPSAPPSRRAPGRARRRAPARGCR